MAKQLVMGNEAIGLGALRAGVGFVCGYPGTCLLYTSLDFDPLHWFRRRPDADGEVPGCRRDLA